MSLNDLMSVTGLARMYDVSRQTVHNWLRNGHLDGHAVKLEGGVWVIQWSPMVGLIIPAILDRQLRGKTTVFRKGRPPGSRSKRASKRRTKNRRPTPVKFPDDPPRDPPPP